MIYYFEPSDRGPWPADDGELENNDSLARCWVDRLRRMVDGAELGAGLAGKFKLERRVSVVALRGGSGSTCILVDKTKVKLLLRVSAEPKSSIYYFTFGVCFQLRRRRAFLGS